MDEKTHVFDPKLFTPVTKIEPMVFEGPRGSGKSTQLASFLLDWVTYYPAPEVFCRLFLEAPRYHLLSLLNGALFRKHRFRSAYGGFVVDEHAWVRMIGSPVSAAATFSSDGMALAPGEFVFVDQSGFDGLLPSAIRCHLVGYTKQL